MSNFDLRPMAPLDAAPVCAVIDGIVAERRFLALQNGASRLHMQKYIEDGLAAGNAMVVALGDDRVIGWCGIRRWERDVYAHRGVVFMGVAQPWRGRGVGRTLLRAALQHALAQGLKRIELEVRADNLAAIHLYTAAGFVEEGDMTDALRVDGASVTLKRMAILF